MEKMKYVQTYCQKRMTIYNYTCYAGLERYDGVYARDKVILRCNLSDIIMRDIFLSDANMEYAYGVCLTLMGIQSINMDYLQSQQYLSDMLKLLVKQDLVFRRKLEEVFYFKFKLANPPMSFFDAIQIEFRNAYELAFNEFLRTTSAIGFSINYKDGPIVWYSIDDTADNVVHCSKKFTQEVVSNAKNWRHLIEAR